MPKYDFNWQLTYDLAEERVFPKGTKFEATATFDHSDEQSRSIPIRRPRSASAIRPGTR